MEDVGVLIVIFGFVLAIIFMGQRHSLRKEQIRRGAMHDADAAAVDTAEFRALAERLEDRVRTLEAILDDESPGWRRKYGRQ